MFKNVHMNTIMTHTKETNNEIIMPYVSALLFSAQTKFLVSSPNDADQN